MKNWLLILLCALAPMAQAATDTVAWSDLESRYRDVLGHTYRAGGQNPGGFDCSGLQKHLFRSFGYTMPASSSSYANWGQSIFGSHHPTHHRCR